MNRLLLPFGLQYALLLAPFLLYWLYDTGRLVDFKFPLLFISSFSVIHLFIGVELVDFIVSTVIQLLLLIFLVAFYNYYRGEGDIGFVIERLTVINFVLVVFAVLLGIKTDILWYYVQFTAGYDTFPRLKLFELEASHYSLSLMPLFYYSFWKSIKEWRTQRKYLWLLVSVAISLLLSFSLGVLAVISISHLIVLLMRAHSFIADKELRVTLSTLTGIASLGLLLLYVVYPENPLFYRIDNLFNGLDTSGRGRTYEAFDIAQMVLEIHNPVFGIGLGQFKIIGRDALIYYYKFANTPIVARLPNCMAETLVTYGFLGFAFKLGLQIFLFVKMKVWANLFRLSLFISLFVYQFTGSYLSNTMEYVLWILVFVPNLTDFDQLKYFNR
jgi:hypothetical protein